MYNPITEKDKQMIAYHKALENVNLSLFPGMNSKQILFNECLYCQMNKGKNWLKIVIKNLFFVHEKMEMDLKSSPILCLYTKNYRNDHDGYWEKIKADIGSYNTITFLTKLSYHIDWKNLHKKLDWFFISMRELSCISNIKDRVYMSVMLAARKWMFEEVKKFELKPKLVMTYFDSGPDENVLVQYFKQQGAITVTNQHGIGIFKSWNYDLMNQSQILNFKSDFFLARSEKQKEEFERAGFDGNRIIVVGYIGNKELRVKLNHTGVLGLFLDTPSMPLSEQASITLIKFVEDISKKMKFKYIVKCHPNDDVHKYKKMVSEKCIGIYGKEISVQESFEMVDIGIVHTSSTYVDAYEYGIRCLKYCSDAYFPISVKEDEFRTCEELENKLNLWNVKPENEKEEYILSIRRMYAGKWKDGNIRNVIEKLLVL